MRNGVVAHKVFFQAFMKQGFIKLQRKYNFEWPTTLCFVSLGNLEPYVYRPKFHQWPFIPITISGELKNLKTNIVRLI